VYASAGGWVTHVASRKRIFSEPLPPLVDYHADPEAWFARRKLVGEMLERAELVDIGGKHDGESFTDDTPDECADRLVYLHCCGYNVPQYAIDELREEAAQAHSLNDA
jgi:hypothetical protein